MKTLQFLIHTNLYISLGAVLLTVESQVQLGMKPQWHPYLFIIFFATLCEYNFHRFVTIITRKDALDSDKHSWVKNNEKAFYLLVFGSVAGFLVSVFLAKREVLLALAPLAFLTLFYSVPIFRNKSRTVRLRDLPYLKILLISLVWASTTVLLPVIQSGKSYPMPETIALIAERFLFVFAITIPFDIRDAETDRRAGLKTIPTLLNERQSYLISYVALVAFSALSLFHFRENPAVAWPLCLSAGFALVVLYAPSIRRLSLYHYAVLDGTILVQSILVLVFYYLTI